MITQFSVGSIGNLLNGKFVTNNIMYIQYGYTYINNNFLNIDIRNLNKSRNIFFMIFRPGFCYNL